jgi:hypothetical protein
MDQFVEDLTLLLMYLTAWDEKVLDETIKRSWKGYLFEVIDSLADKGYIHASRRSKSVYLTESGLDKAEELKNIHTWIM